MSERLDFVMRLIDKITGPASRASKSLHGVDKSLTGIGKNRALEKIDRDAVKAATGVDRLGAAGDKMLRTSANLNLAANSMKQLSQIAGAMFLGPVMEAAKFEQSISAVKAVTSDFSDEQSALARQLGRDTKFTADQAAGAMLNLGRAGFNAKQQMAALGSVLNLDAASGMGDLAQSADIVTNIMSGFSLEADKTTNSADILTRVFSNSNVTLEELGQTMSFVAPVAAQVGVSLKETAVLAGALGDAGIKGTRGGTALRLMLVNLAGASPPATKALKKLGVETQDAAGNLLPVTDILNDVVKKFGKLGTAEKTVKAAEIFGLRGATAGLVLLNSLSKKASGSIDKLNRASSNMSITAKGVAEVMEDNLLGDVTKVESAVSSLKIAIGAELNPELRTMAQSVKEILPEIESWVGKNRELVKTLGKAAGIFAVTTAALAGLAITASSIALVFGGLAKAAAGIAVVWAKAGALFSVMAVGAKATVVALTPLFSVMVAGAKATAALALSFVTLPVVMGAALVGAVVAVVVWRDEFLAIVDGIPSKFLELGADMAQGLIDGWKAIFGSFNIVENVDSMVQSIKSVLGIASPSKVMAGIGKNMSAGLQQGMDSGIGANAPARFAGGAAAGMAGGGASARTMIFRPTVQVTVSGGSTGASDGAAVGESVVAALRRVFDDANAALGSA